MTSNKFSNCVIILLEPLPRKQKRIIDQVLRCVSDLKIAVNDANIVQISKSVKDLTGDLSSVFFSELLLPGENKLKKIVGIRYATSLQLVFVCICFVILSP